MEAIVSFFEANQKIFLLITVTTISFIIIYSFKWALAFTIGRYQKLKTSKISTIISKEISRVPLILIVYTAVWIGWRVSDLKFVEGSFDSFFNFLLYFAWVFIVIKIFNRSVDLSIRELIKKTEDQSMVSVYSFGSISIRFFVWITGILFIFANLGYDVSAFIAGLGIGGLAIALALQNILKDLFSTILILLDKPFRIGDNINSGDGLAEVREIGIRSTRLRTEDGVEIIVPNGDLIDKTVKNYKRLTRFHLVYNLTLEKDDSQKLNIITGAIARIFDKYGLSKLDITPISLTDSDFKLRVTMNLKKDEEIVVDHFLATILNELYTGLRGENLSVKSVEVDQSKTIY